LVQVLPDSEIGTGGPYVRVLLVEDDDIIGSAVRDHIAAAGHGVDWAQSLAGAQDCLAVVAYDLILLDLGLPDGQGIDLLRHLRAGTMTGPVQTDARTPVVIVSARDQITERIEGLNAGADDYLVKPFDLSELSARFAAVTRRSAGQASPTRRFGTVAIDFAHRSILRDGKPVVITAREWAVLERLTRTSNARVSKSEIEDSLYEFGAEVESNTVEVYISRLRKKLGRDFVTTLRGIGYMVPVDDSAHS
jgi:two-component system, OmpR family, response regulator